MFYYQGFINPFWDDSYKNYQYIRRPALQEEIDKWVSMGYDPSVSFTGGMYDNKNPMPAWVNNFQKILPLKNQTYTFYKMLTLDVMPEHVDHFKTYMRVFNAEFKNICRALIMLEDWRPGHYLEINKTGIINWKAGDYFFWESNVPHGASNIGTDPRYTLQITGEYV
jgi:hypothetical protein